MTSVQAGPVNFSFGRSGPQCSIEHFRKCMEALRKSMAEHPVQKDGPILCTERQYEFLDSQGLINHPEPQEGESDR